MRHTVAIRSDSLPALVGLISILALGLGTQAVAVEGDGFFGSLVGELADAADLTPLIAADPAVPASPASSRAPTYLSQGRQSVPAADRATRYREVDLFQNSKVALPLLVADLDAKAGPVARPMSGRLVGARPSAVQTRSTASLGSDSGVAGTQISVSWSNLGGR